MNNLTKLSFTSCYNDENPVMTTSTQAVILRNTPSGPRSLHTVLRPNY